LNITADTLEMLANTFKIPLLEPISNTTQSLLKCIEVCLNKPAVYSESHAVILGCQTKQERLCRLDGENPQLTQRNSYCVYQVGYGGRFATTHVEAYREIHWVLELMNSGVVLTSTLQNPLQDTHLCWSPTKWKQI
jgi:hypothetical protein